jgi:DNA polymerase-1
MPEAPAPAITPPARFLGPNDVHLLSHLSDILVLDVETTQLTAFASPLPQGKSAKIGTGHTLAKYKAEYGGDLDTTPRCRIITYGCALTGLSLAYDLDLFACKNERQPLIDALAGKILIGHNLLFDLAWLCTLDPRASELPQFVLCTMLVTRFFAAQALVDAHENPLNAPLIKKYGKPEGFVGTSLDVVGQLAGEDPLDKGFQHPRNWMLENLSPGHLDYCVGDVVTPAVVLKWLSRSGDDIRAICDRLTDNAQAKTLDASIRTLAAMHGRGMPFSAEDAERLKVEYSTRLAAQAHALAQASPLLAPFETTFKNPGAGLSADIKDAFVWALWDRGVKAPETAKGEVSLNADALLLAQGAENAQDILEPWRGVQDAGKKYSFAAEWQTLARVDGRVHPLIGINTVTGRMSSQMPNSQNMPRAAELRALVKARPGHEIVAIDYPQIELRIAAAIAVRTMREIEACLAGQIPAHCVVYPDVIKALQGNLPPLLNDEEIERLEGKERGIAYRGRTLHELHRAYTDVLAQGMPLAEVFRRDLDPHLLTAIVFAAKAGLDLGGLTPLDYITKAFAEGRKGELKDQLSDERQSAKAGNFGLLYGMSAGGLRDYAQVGYGVNMTLEEATQTRVDWFEAYPEVRLWHTWVKLTHLHTPIAYRRSETKSCNASYSVLTHAREVETRMRKVWSSRTLSGRKVYGTRAMDVLNYSDQGTGADMLLGALERMRQHSTRVDQHLINLVHDEAIFEWPTSHFDTLCPAVIECMSASAEAFLLPYDIPLGEMDYVRGDVWLKG